MARTLKTTLPNFLVVGVARSGTTSIYHYLSQHPQIFMSSVKEPCYLTAKFMSFPHNGKGDDMWERSLVTDFNRYQALFQDVGEAVRLGEASPNYLHSYDRVIPVIRDLLGDIPIIIMLRNPVERAFSAYMLLRRLGREVLSFEEALAKEEERIAQNYSFIWFYSKLSYYAESVKAYLDNFTRVGIFLYENFQKDTGKIIQEIYEFLGVNATFSPNLRVYNASGIPRNKLLYKWLTESNSLKALLKPSIEAVYPEEKRMHVIESLKTKLVQKPSINSETRASLQSLYREDILNLQKLIECDIDPWLS